MDAGNAVFRKSAGFDDAFRNLDLNEEAAAIVAEIDGSKSAAEIAGSTGEDAFNVYKLLEALRILGHIEKGQPAADLPQDDLGFEAAGVADAADAWTASPPEPESAPQQQPEPRTADLELPPGLPAIEQTAPLVQLQFDEERKIPFALKSDPASTAPVAADWGFDEAQVEAVHRAVDGPMEIPMPAPRRRPAPPPAKPKRSGGLVFTLIIILLIAGIAGGGWLWWQGRNAAPSPAVVHTAKRPVIHPATTTSAPMPPTETTASFPMTVPSVVTSTAAPAKTTTAPPPAHVPATVPKAAPAAVSRLEQTTTGKTITNTSASATPGDKNRGHYDELARGYAQKPSGNFTIQFELVCQTSSLAKAEAAGGPSVWFLPTTYRGQSCYRVFWGHFDTRQAAVSAVDRIPAGLRGSTPVVVAIPKS